MSPELWFAFLGCMTLGAACIYTLRVMCKQVDEDRKQCGKQ